MASLKSNKNMNLHPLFVLFSLAILTGSCSEQDKILPVPQITAQGFYIQDAQPGKIGDFGDLKVRIEAPGKIDNLKIAERSYSVDLARTPEQRHFALFGLKRRIEVQTDVTLNFRNYINTKLIKEGIYEFAIEVTDKKGKTTRQNLRIEVQPKTEESKILPTPVETGKFHLERVGKSTVKGAKRFGIQWITTDEIRVTIQVSKSAGHAGSVGEISSQDYQRLKTRDDIQQVLSGHREKEFIEFETASNAATGRYIIVEEQGEYYFLSILSSHTSLSKPGTTVTLRGEYKY